MTAVDTSHQQRRSFLAVALLIVGVIGAIVLTFDALTGGVPGQPVIPVGSPSADPGSVELPSGRDAVVPDGPRILVVHDAFTPSEQLSSIFTVNLVGHFGPVEHRRIDEFRPEDLDAADALVYVGTSHERAVPPPIIRVVAAGDLPTLWMGWGADQIGALVDGYEQGSGVAFEAVDVHGSERVSYRDVALPRDPEAGRISRGRVLDHTRARIIATTATDVGVVPYAIRSGNLTWLAEVPFAHTSEADRGLVLADVLFDVLDPERPSRHRALVRLEDVGPSADPDALRAIADELFERGVPFSVATYPVWNDPQGAYNNGDGIRLADQPDVVDALRYMEERGGTLLFHGVTHQYGSDANPYQGVSGEDFEFFATHIDADDNVILDGPVADDSPEWMAERIRWGLAEFADAGLDAPTIFEFPHYAGSVTSYETIAPIFEARFERTTYFSGYLEGEPTLDAFTDQAFPYPVVDVYGERVIPENMGNYIEVGYNNNDSRSADDLLAAAERQLVVRDNVAGFFFHPYLDPAPLLAVVDGMQAMGYEFVSPAAVLESP